MNLFRGVMFDVSLEEYTCVFSRAQGKGWVIISDRGATYSYSKVEMLSFFCILSI